MENAYLYLQATHTYYDKSLSYDSLIMRGPYRGWTCTSIFQKNSFSHTNSLYYCPYNDHET